MFVIFSVLCKHNYMINNLSTHILPELYHNDYYFDIIYFELEFQSLNLLSCLSPVGAPPRPPLPLPLYGLSPPAPPLGAPPLPLNGLSPMRSPLGPPLPLPLKGLSPYGPPCPPLVMGGLSLYGSSLYCCLGGLW